VVVRSIALAALALTLAGAAPAAGPIDPALVGTWKLEWPRPDLYWAVRTDGIYRIHGPGATPRQVGRLEARQGRFTMRSLVWIDEGTYQLVEPGTWRVTGRLGPGTWTRVWAPGQSAGAVQPAPAGACRLVTAEEVARVLWAPATGGPDPRAGEGGCLFRSLLGGLDQLSISLRINQGRFYQNTRKTKQARIVDVPGIGDQAYAEPDGAGGPLALHVLRHATWVSVRLTLHPPATTEDLPSLVELVRALAQRL
jgi:hypothetical protein